jgi:hypothetical protein
VNKEHLITSEKAAEIAKKEFLELKMGPLDEFNMEVSDKIQEGRWDVIFTGRGQYQRPGYHVAILIDKTTGNVKVIRGQ